MKPSRRWLRSRAEKAEPECETRAIGPARALRGREAFGVGVFALFVEAPQLCRDLGVDAILFALKLPGSLPYGALHATGLGVAQRREMARRRRGRVGG